MEDVHCLLESNRVHRSIRVPVVRLDNLQHARTEPLPRPSPLARFHPTARCRARFPCPPWPPRETSRNPAWRTRPNAAASRRQPGHVAPTRLSQFWDNQASRQASVCLTEVVLPSPFRICERRDLRGPRSRAIMPGLGAPSGDQRHLETRRNSGGDHVPYCTPPDAVEPAPRRIGNPAGRAGSHRFQQQPS